MPLFDVYPINDIVIQKAKGSFVWDENNVQYLDMYGGHAVISIGHNHPHWVERIEKQLHEISFYSNSVKIPIQNQLSEKLNQISSKENYQLFLCNSGAEANENALKLASFHTGRKKILAFSKSFHGRTSLAVAATDNPSIVAPVNETGNIDFIPFNDTEVLLSYFQNSGNELAAVIIEPIQGVGGIHVATKDFLQTIRTLCTKYNSLFIADEVQCGYGRSGKFFALDHAGVHADIYSVAKGMGNGFPVGGILIAPHIKPKYGMLGTTFGGNHLACAAALAVLEVIESEKLIEHAHLIGEKLSKSLMELNEFTQVRGQGLMIGFDVPEKLKDLKRNLLNRQFIFTGEAKPNIIRLLPALNISGDEITKFLNAIHLEIKLVHKEKSRETENIIRN
ncbi:MAG: aspartate aminotransferase family protein [Flavisolibacter sp.]|nr:aspartate aminotransferase family protein [Flavisolibacter sp.]